MKPGDLTHTYFSDYDKDFKAEVIAAELVDHGINTDNILILMLGAMKRTYSKDVQSIEEESSEYDHKEYVLVKTPKEGIYDMLPQGLFHHPTVSGPGKTEEEILNAVKRRKKEESDARKFFLPFEATINFLRMQMSMYENRLDKRSHHNDLVNIFSARWEIFNYLDARQANIFLHLIPIIHNLREDLPAIEKIMEMMLLVPVSVILQVQLPLYPAEPIMSIMGESMLGVDLTTGNVIYEEGVDEILIKIGPVDNEAFHKFLPGGINGHMLTLLKDHLLPAHLDVITEFVRGDKYKVTRLADEISDYNSVLGADTYL